jgi:mannose-1-phosphate guanylyltransferase
VLLCGTHVWNACSLDSLCPHPLLPIANRALVDYTAEWLRAAGITHLTICTNENGSVVQRYLGDGARQQLDAHYYWDYVPRGPAGCVRDALDTTPAEHCVVVAGNVIPEVDLLKLLAVHIKCAAAATVPLAELSPAAGGSGREPQTTGVYVFARRALGLVPPTGYQDIKEMLIPRLRAARELVLAQPVAPPQVWVKGLKTYLCAQAWALQRGAAGAGTEGGYGRRGEAYVHETARVADSALLLGAVMVGPGARIDSGAVLVGPTVVGRRCLIERGAVVSRTVMWDESAVGAAARVDQALLTTGAQVPAGDRLYGGICGWQTSDGGASRGTQLREASRLSSIVGAKADGKNQRAFTDLERG